MSPRAAPVRGVILAGGSGSRLLPLTRTVNKHLLPVGRQPMIYHPLQRLLGADIRDILIVTGVEHIGDLINQLRSGQELGCRLTYRCQDDPLGIADALRLAEDFAQGGPLAVLLGDNIFTAPLGPPLARYRASGQGAQIHLHRVPDPRRFGVPRFDPTGRLVEIVEKPATPPSAFAVTGIYFYDAQVFDHIRDLTPSPSRGEYEISDINTRYIQAGRMRLEILPGHWTDAGTHPSLRRANRFFDAMPDADADDSAAP